MDLLLKKPLFKRSWLCLKAVLSLIWILSGVLGSKDVQLGCFKSFNVSESFWTKAFSRKVRLSSSLKLTDTMCIAACMNSEVFDCTGYFANLGRNICELASIKDLKSPMEGPEDKVNVEPFEDSKLHYITATAGNPG